MVYIFFLDYFRLWGWGLGGGWGLGEFFWVGVRGGDWSEGWNSERKSDQRCLSFLFVEGMGLELDWRDGSRGMIEFLMFCSKSGK
jgi:hypothetical protein